MRWMDIPHVVESQSVKVFNGELLKGIIFLPQSLSLLISAAGLVIGLIILDNRSQRGRLKSMHCPPLFKKKTEQH